MNNEKPTTLADVSRKNNSGKVNKFANSLMPAAPKPRTDTPPPTEPEIEGETETEEVVDAPVAMVAAPSAPKADRPKKASGFSVDDIVNVPAKDGVAFNKMVRVTDEHHELLRLLAFQHRKPMNVLVHNLIAMLEQVYQKEQKKGDQ